MPTHSTPTLLTRADLDDFPDDGHRYELVDGELLVSPPPRIIHQHAVMEIAFQVRCWIEDGGHGIVLPTANVELSPDTHLEPDVLWTSDASLESVGYDVAPEFIVEVASRSTRLFDRNVKKDRYLSNGCVDFWIVDHDHDTIEQFDAPGDPPTIHHRGDTFASPLFDGLTFNVDDLLGPA